MQWKTNCMRKEQTAYWCSKVWSLRVCKLSISCYYHYNVKLFLCTLCLFRASNTTMWSYRPTYLLYKAYSQFMYITCVWHYLFHIHIYTVGPCCSDYNFLPFFSALPLLSHRHRKGDNIWMTLNSFCFNRLAKLCVHVLLIWAWACMKVTVKATLHGEFKRKSHVSTEVYVGTLAKRTTRYISHRAELYERMLHDQFCAVQTCSKEHLYIKTTCL